VLAIRAERAFHGEQAIPGGALVPVDGVRWPSGTSNVQGWSL
jgi:hypothetical protein